MDVGRHNFASFFFRRDERVLKLEKIVKKGRSFTTRIRPWNDKQRRNRCFGDFWRRKEIFFKTKTRFRWETSEILIYFRVIAKFEELKGINGFLREV